MVSDAGVESNARLTGTTAAVLLVLLAVEGVTVLRVRALLTPHVFIGMLLMPPVLLKIGSTGWRFVRYYRGSPAYRRKGPPATLLRLLGPVVVILTVVLLASGVALVLGPHSLRHSLLFAHKASFVLWFGAMTIHVFGHLRRHRPAGPQRLGPPHPPRRGRRYRPPVGAGRQPGRRCGPRDLDAGTGRPLPTISEAVPEHLAWPCTGP